MALLQTVSDFKCAVPSSESRVLFESTLSLFLKGKIYPGCKSQSNFHDTVSGHRTEIRTQIFPIKKQEYY